MSVVAGPLLPGMPNLHSHAFQRAMAGLAEEALNPEDSFWTWRELMYRLVGRLTPEQVQAIATHLYIEMLKGGYTSVAEFHYLHHQPGGTPYANLAEMAERIVGGGGGVRHRPDRAAGLLCPWRVRREAAGREAAALQERRRRAISS